MILALILTLTIPFQRPGMEVQSCDESPVFKEGLQHRDSFEQFRRSPVVELGFGLKRIDMTVWPWKQAEGHYRSAIGIFKQVTDDQGELGSCSYRELIRLLLYNRYHRNENPHPRSHEEFSEALAWSSTYREHYPDESWAWLMRGLVLYLDGRIEESGAQFERAKEVDRKGVEQFRSDLPESIVDPYLSTSVNEAEVSAWARAVYADMFYPGWRQSDGGEMLSPGRYIVAFGIPQTLEVRVKPYNDPIEGPVPEKLYFRSHDDLVSFEDAWRTKDWYVTSESDIDVRGRFRVEGFEYIDPRREVSIYGTTLRFRESNGGTHLASVFGLPFPGSMPEGQMMGQVRLGTVALDNENTRLGSTVNELMGISTSDMAVVDTMLVWSAVQTMPLPIGTTRIVSETFSESWFSKQARSVEPLPGQGLVMSDIVVAHSVLEGEYELSGAFVRPGFTISPKARPVISIDEPTRIYFEVYGLHVDDSNTARAEIRIDVEPNATGGFVRRLFQSRSRGVGVRLNWIANSSDDGIYLDIDPGALERGPVTLTATIRDVATGESVSSKLVAEVF